MWRTYLTVLVVYIGDCVTAMYDEKQCSYSFNVWHPDQNVLEQLKDLQMQFSNFTNYAELQVSRIQRNVIHEMRLYDSNTTRLENEVLDVKVSNMQAKLAQTKLASNVEIMKKDFEILGRKVDDLELDYFSLRAKSREPRTDSFRKGRHRHTDKDALGLMRNSVGDLKAEWLLMKRELDDIRSENVLLKHCQNDLKNDTSELKNVISSLTGNIKLRDGARDWQASHQNHLGQFELSDIKQELSRIREEQTDLKEQTSEVRNDIATLHNSNIRVQKELHELQLESKEIRGKLESLRRQERNGRETEVTREGQEIKLPRSDIPSARDCHEIYQAGYRVSGVYNIHVKGARMMTPVYCELVNKTGLIILMRRIDGLLNFNRRWVEYKYGFGNPYGEFYIGNELIHLLTNQKQYILRVDLWDWEGNKAYAEYKAVTVENETGHYRLHVSGYHGDAGDSLNYHDNMAFSTEDVDNDLHARHCAAENKGGWWFNSCYSSNLNGIYHTAWYSQSRSNFADGVVWYTWKESEFYSLKKVEMKLKPKMP